MEIPAKTENSLISISCIAKSVDLRPSIVYIDSIDEENALVKPCPGRYYRPLNVPRSMLFHVNEELLGKLKAAYEQKDQQTLERLWKRAKPWTL